MIREEIKHITSSPRDLRNFGLIVGGIFFILGIVFELRGKSFAHATIAIGTILLLGGLLWPKVLTYPHKAWMTLAVIIGFIINTLLLAVFFYIGVSPIAVIVRLTGKRFLDIRFRTTDSTYWQKRIVLIDKTRYEKQF